VESRRPNLPNMRYQRRSARGLHLGVAVTLTGQQHSGPDIIPAFPFYTSEHSFCAPSPSRTPPNPILLKARLHRPQPAWQRRDDASATTTSSSESTWRVSTAYGQRGDQQYIATLGRAIFWGLRGKPPANVKDAVAVTALGLAFFTKSMSRGSHQRHMRGSP
jgi:hypothetical protein